MRLTLAVLALLLLAGCGTAAENYAGQPGARMALAQCRAQSNMAPSMALAASNPFFAAAMQQQYVNDCMTAKGFP